MLLLTVFLSDECNNDCTSNKIFNKNHLMVYDMAAQYFLTL
jgi:hypothetical protein